jgi:hypothetical protein
LAIGNRQYQNSMNNLEKSGRTADNPIFGFLLSAGIADFGCGTMPRMSAENQPWLQRL